MNAAMPIAEALPATEAYRAVHYEAFNCSGADTRLLQPLDAATLVEALAETTSRWSWDRGDRLAVRQVGEGVDFLYVYAVRRKSQGIRRSIIDNMEYGRWLDHVCTIDLNVIAGIPRGLVGCEVDLHRHDQARRPDGARLERSR